MTLLEEIIDKYPSKPWNWNRLSANPEISFRFILDHPSFPWNPHGVSMNASVCEDDILSMPNYAWNFDGLCYNPNLGYQFYLKYMINPAEVFHINWAALSINPSITTLDVIEHSHQPWKDRFLSANPNITSTFILNEGRTRKWHPPSVWANKGIQERDILKGSLTAIMDCDYRGLSANKNLPMVYVNDNIEHDWNFNSISINATMHDVEQFHKIAWDADGLSMNPNISFDYVLSRNMKWNVRSLLTVIDVEIIMDNIDWFKQQIDPSERVEKYMSSNKSITMEWIDDHKDFIDWERLSNNCCQ